MRAERPLPAEGQAARITELWAWTIIDPLTDVEGIMAARLPGGGALPMVGSIERLVRDLYGPIARQTAHQIDPPCEARLRHFVAAEEVRRDPV